MCFCCGRMLTSQRIHLLMYDWVRGRKRSRRFKKLCIWTITLKKSSIYLWKQPVVMSCKINWVFLHPNHFFSIRFKMSGNAGDNRISFRKLESKIGLYLVVLTTLKTSRKKLTLFVIAMQQLADLGKDDPTKKFFWPKKDFL